MAEERFVTSRDNYVMWVIKSAFGDLFEFFEGVEECLKSIDIEDITFQTQFSKNRLKSLIKKRETTFPKEIADMVKRMEKHIGPKMDPYNTVKTDYVLFGEVWDYLTLLFIKRYTRMEEMTKQCYTNITVKPSSQEVTDSFKKVKQEWSSRLYSQ